MMKYRVADDDELSKEIEDHRLQHNGIYIFITYKIFYFILPVFYLLSKQSKFFFIFKKKSILKIAFTFVLKQKQSRIQRTKSLYGLSLTLTIVCA